MLSVETAMRALEVEAGAGLEQVKEAFRRTAQVAHPDRGGSDDLFRRAREAYELLIVQPMPLSPAGGRRGGAEWMVGRWSKSRATGQWNIIATDDQDVYLLNPGDDVWVRVETKRGRVSFVAGRVASRPFYGHYGPFQGRMCVFVEPDGDRW